MNLNKGCIEINFHHLLNPNFHSMNLNKGCIEI